jgi:serine/threonine protein kinase
MFALLFGHLPFEDQVLKNIYARSGYDPSFRKSTINVFQLYQFISRNSLEFPKHTAVSNEALDLLKGMLKSDPGKRITLSDIFRHAWFANSQLL